MVALQGLTPGTIVGHGQPSAQAPNPPAPQSVPSVDTVKKSQTLPVGSVCMFGRAALWPVVGQLIILAESNLAGVLIIGSVQPIDVGQLARGQKGKKDRSVKSAAFPNACCSLGSCCQFWGCLKKKNSNNNN